MPSAAPIVDDDVDISNLIGEETPWNVLVHNDPVNAMTYVSMVFMEVLKLTAEKAEALMWQIHTNGKAIVWSGEYDKAEAYVTTFHSYQLQATLEKAS